MSTKIAFIILKKQRMLKILKNLKSKQIEMIYAWTINKSILIKLQFWQKQRKKVSIILHQSCQQCYVGFAWHRWRRNCRYLTQYGTHPGNAGLQWSQMSEDPEIRWKKMLQETPVHF